MKILAKVIGGIMICWDVWYGRMIRIPPLGTGTIVVDANPTTTHYTTVYVVIWQLEPGKAHDVAH